MATHFAVRRLRARTPWFRSARSVSAFRLPLSFRNSRLRFATRLSPSFSTRGVCNAGRRSRTTSWSKGLYHRSDVLVLIQKLTARANAGWRLSRQCELELLEQDFMIGLWMGVAA